MSAVPRVDGSQGVVVPAEVAIGEAPAPVIDDWEHVGRPQPTVAEWTQLQGAFQLLQTAMKGVVENAECPVEFEVPANVVRLSCGHTLSETAWLGILNASGDRPKCPLDRIEVGANFAPDILANQQATILRGVPAALLTASPMDAGMVALAALQRENEQLRRVMGDAREDIQAQNVMLHRHLVELNGQLLSANKQIDDAIKGLVTAGVGCTSAAVLALGVAQQVLTLSLLMKGAIAVSLIVAATGLYNAAEALMRTPPTAVATV